MTKGCKVFSEMLLLHVHRVHIHKTTCTAFAEKKKKINSLLRLVQEHQEELWQKLKMLDGLQPWSDLGDFQGTTSLLNCVSKVS